MALIPSGYLNAVCSLGVVTEDSFSHKGTGFLYSHPILIQDNVTHYCTYLVTNKHVLEGVITHIRYNRIGDDQVEVQPIESVTLQDSKGWVKHPNSDVAAVMVLSPGPLMVNRDLVKPEVFLGDIGTPTDEEKLEIVEGNGVFIIGFPMGLVGKTRNYPIVRQGIIARITDWMRGDESTFIVDSSAFPGNSGGPVILKPEATAIQGTKNITHALLIGIVSSYIPYRDVAISSQTGNPRVVFEENSGLAEVVPIELIKEMLPTTESHE